MPARVAKGQPGMGGPKTLRAELEADGSFAATLPSRSSIGRFLKEQGLTRRYEPPRVPLPVAPARTAKAPHQLWEMDARGNEKVVAGLGTVALIDLNDRYSRARILSYPCPLERAQSLIPPRKTTRPFCAWPSPSGACQSSF